MPGPSLSRRAFAVAAAAALFAPALPAAARSPEAMPSLRHQATSGGRFFGAAVRADQIEADAELRERIIHECGVLTPEIHLKWNSIENKQGRYWYDPVDRLVELASHSGQHIHGHTLLWEQSTPSWALKAIRKHQDWSLVEGHIERVVSRYDHAVRRWDVVNEPIDTENGVGGLRRNSFHAAFGHGYIAEALAATRRWAPGAKLLINDYSFEYDNHVERDRRLAMLKLAERLRKAGAPLDGIGLQAHLDLRKGPLKAKLIAPFLSAIADMGLEIVITELDVKEADYRASTEIRDRRVADEVERYLDIVLGEPAVKGVITWGLSDKHSWLKAPNRGLPYDAALRPKEMRQAIATRLGGLAAG
jgi:endo-1,4-beta-xylanase